MIRKRSMVIAGHATSVSLEPEFWELLRHLAVERGVALAALVAEIDGTRTGGLSSALRVFVLRQVVRDTAFDAVIAAQRSADPAVGSAGSSSSDSASS